MRKISSFLNSMNVIKQDLYTWKILLNATHLKITILRIIFHISKDQLDRSFEKIYFTASKSYVMFFVNQNVLQHTSF